MFLDHDAIFFNHGDSKEQGISMQFNLVFNSL